LALVEPTAITAGTTGGLFVAGAVGVAGPVVRGVVGAAEPAGAPVVGSVVGPVVAALGDGAVVVADGAFALSDDWLPCGPQPTSTAAESAAVTVATAIATGDLLRIPIISSSP
jgi:hypothetical protein